MAAPPAPAPHAHAQAPEAPHVSVWPTVSFPGPAAAPEVPAASAGPAEGGLDFKRARFAPKDPAMGPRLAILMAETAETLAESGRVAAPFFDGGWKRLTFQHNKNKRDPSVNITPLVEDGLPANELQARRKFVTAVTDWMINHCNFHWYHHVLLSPNGKPVAYSSYCDCEWEEESDSD